MCCQEFLKLSLPVQSLLDVSCMLGGKIVNPYPIKSKTLCVSNYNLPNPASFTSLLVLFINALLITLVHTAVYEVRRRSTNIVMASVFRYLGRPGNPAVVVNSAG